MGRQGERRPVPQGETEAAETGEHLSDLADPDGREPSFQGVVLHELLNSG